MSTLKETFCWRKPLLFDSCSPLCIWLNVINVTVMSMLAIVDLLSSVIILTEMQGALAIDNNLTQWLVKSFFFASALMPLCSIHFAEKYGYKLALFLGNILFSIGAIGSGLATGFYVMIFFRSLAGVGGGIMMSISLNLINYTVPEKSRADAITAYTNLYFGFGIAVGVLLGGYIGQTLHWRYLFLMNLYLSLPTLLLTWILIPETEKKQIPRYNFFGFACLSLFFFALLMIVMEAKAPWNTMGWYSPFIKWCVVACFVTLGSYILNSLTSKHPLIHHELFKHLRFWIGCIGLIIVGFMVFGPTLVMVGYLESIYLYQRLTIGYLVSIVGFMYLLFGVATTVFANRIPPRVFILIGLPLIIISCFFNQGITIQSTPFQIGELLALRSIGIALVLGPLTVMALSPFDPKESQHAVSVLVFCRLMAATFGSAIVDLIIAERAPFHALTFGEQVNTYSARYQQYFQEINTQFTNVLGQGPALGPKQSTLFIIDWIQGQAYLAGLNDAFFILGWAISALLIIIIIMISIRIWRSRNLNKSFN